jgi:pimeloyl-ACP methyl ester carboxylesterase
MSAVPTPLSPAHRCGDGTPLVLLHGIAMSWRAWQPVIPLLAERHEVFAPSLAGHHGAVPCAPGTSWSVSGLSDALERQLDEAGIDTAHVAGNSLGGWVALEMARRGRARSVVALSPAGGWRSHRDLRRVARLVQLGRTFAYHPLRATMLSHPRIRRAILRGVSERGHRMSATEANALFQDNLACTALRDLLASMAHDGPLPALTDAGCPIRIAWSQHDRVIPFPRYGQPLAEAIPDAELLSLLGVGHIPMHDNPRLIAATILEFTSRVDHETQPAGLPRSNTLRRMFSRPRGRATDSHARPARRAG